MREESSRSNSISKVQIRFQIPVYFVGSKVGDFTQLIKAVVCVCVCLLAVVVMLPLPYDVSPALT